jgi:hypothetical protein
MNGVYYLSVADIVSIVCGKKHRIPEGDRSKLSKYIAKIVFSGEI